METPESFRRRIHVAQEIQSVVRTMKTLAAVSIRQYESAVVSLADYNRTLRLGFQILFRSLDDREQLEAASDELSSAAARPSPAYGAIVFGSDQGMCGQFNQEIADYTLAYMRQVTGSTDEWSAMTVGTRVHGRLEDVGLTITASADLPGSLSGITPFVQQLLPQLEGWRTEHNFARVFVFYNHRLSPATYRPNHVRLLPPDFRTLSRPLPDDLSFHTLPTFSMDGHDLLRALVRQYLFVYLFRACAESLASENASRIAAMQAAEKSIEERLSELQSRFNQMRQTAITEEILDVVTGYEALMREETR